jgi:phosphoglycerol transferase MdoB-like AlkP superfamily enzyme
LNHSAVNPVFSFLSSFEKTASNIVDYDFFSQGECDTLMKGLYPTTSVSTAPLLTTTRPDIVIILMESAGSIFEEAMPHLRRLKGEGIDFTACYGNTWRTDRGTVCTYSGYPSFPTSSVMKMPQKTNHLPGIAASLRKAGYQTSYLYGGDINFTNMRSFLVTTGWEKLIWKADYNSEEQNSAKWGVRDDITFNTLYEQIAAIDTAANHQRHLFGFSTLSSHEPWDVPLRKLDQEIPNAFYYLDTCIGDFINKLKQLPQWENLLIIFLPDHSIDYGQYTEALQERNKIPMVWAGGAVKTPRKITKLCNQTDLAATLLAQLQLPHDQYRWSRDVLSASYRYPFAVHNYNNGFTMADSTGFIAFDLESNRLITNKSSQATRLERMGKAILQATTADLKAIGTK